MGGQVKLLVDYQLDCKTAVLFANTFDLSSKARSGASVKTDSETGARHRSVGNVAMWEGAGLKN